MPKLQVLSAAPTILDYSLIEKRLQEFERADDTRGRTFARYVLASYFCIPEPEIDSHITDGGADRGIDLVYIDENHRIINFGNCKSVSTFRKAKTNFPGDEIDKIISFLEDFTRGREELLDEVNGALASKVREIWELFENGERYELRLHLFSNQLKLAPSEADRLARALSMIQIKLFEHGLYELVHGVVKATKARFTKRLRATHDNHFNFKEKGHTGWSLRTDLKTLFAFLCGPDKGQFDERLIQPNVRYFLGLETFVNDEIRNALIERRLEDFWFMNNGITIACDSTVVNGSANLGLTLVNPRIVNGAQTASIIYEVGKHNLIDLSRATINIKLIETQDESFAEAISIASNTQNRIYGRDLKVFDSLQEKLAISLADCGYKYVRKRGEQLAGKNSIDMARAGQLLLAYNKADPVKCKTQSNAIFDSLYEEAFPSAVVSAELIIAAHELHSQIEVRRQKALHWQRSVARNSFAETWIIEGHYHVLFVVGELMRRRQIDLTDYKVGLTLIDEAISVVDQFVSSHRQSSAYRLFRTESSKERLLTLLDGLSGPWKQESFDF